MILILVALEGLWLLLLKNDALRNLQGDIKGTLECGLAWNGFTFINDSLFCEWGYIVNFDTKTLEVYQGFQTDPYDKGRYATETRYRSDKSYYSCALIAELPLDHLPDKLDYLEAGCEA